MINNNQTLRMTGVAFTALGCLYAEAREPGVQDVPVAVTSISGDGLGLTSAGALDANTIRDLQALVPNGIAPVGGLNGSVTPRGDRFYFSDIERIEVLRGPQGSLYGKDSESGVTATLGLGYNGNITYNPFDKHSTGYATAALAYQYSQELAPQSTLDLGFSYQYTRYDSAIKWGDDSFRDFDDFNFYASYKTQLSPSAELDLDLSLNDNEQGSIAGGFRWPGPLWESVFSYDAGAEVTWRTDGQDLSASGFVFRTGLRYKGYNEDEFDYHDFDRLTLSQEIIYRTGANTGYYLRGEFIDTQFDEMEQCDSDGYRATLGFYRPLPCGSSLRIGGGIESFDYDDPYLDDDTDLIMEILLGGVIGRGRFSLGAQYRTFQDFPNWGGKYGVDMRGLQIGGRVIHPITDRLNIKFALESVHLNGEIAEDTENALSFQSGTIGLGYKVNDDTTIDLTTGLDRSSVTTNKGNTETDISSRYFLGARIRF